MIFAIGWILHFLWAIPLFAFVLMVRHRRRQRSLGLFAEQSLLKKLTLEDHKGKRFLKALLLLFALGALVFALAGPRWGSHYQEVSRKGVDIMMLVDVSRSMMVEDVEPNRLERATREIIDFLKVVEGDRVGLTAFAGAAFIQCPLTLDYAALEMFLNVLQPGIIPVPGTDLGKAIETGLSGFDAKTETDKVMLLITDGEDNENRGLEAARKAADQGIKIFVFGMGDPSGGPIPAGKDQGGFKKDQDGNLVLSKLDEKALQEIAMTTGGGYVRSMAGDLDLDIPVVGLAKRMEEVYMPGRPEPLRIPRDEEALHLLQRVRDEAHRFAITYHRKLRSRSMIDSTLDDVSGIGPTRKKALLRRFGSLKRIRAASREELGEALPEAVADNLHAVLHDSQR